MNYTDAALLLYLATGHTGSCVNGVSGSNDLTNVAIPAATLSKRACQGIVLFNNFIDVLANTTLSVDATLNTLTGTVTTAFTAACALVSNNGVCTVMAQNECETDYTYLTAPVQKYYGYIWETFFI